MTAQAADLLTLPLDRVAVVLIDFQNDFCSPDIGGGDPPPPNTHNEQTARRANSFAEQAGALGAHLIYTRQVLDMDMLTERQRRWESPSGLCAVGSWGAELYLPPVTGSVIVTKHRFDCWQSPEFVRALDERGIDGLIICGVELVCCVLYATQGAAERGYHYLVPTDLVSGRDLGDQTDNRAVRDYLRHNQPDRLTTAAELLAVWRS
ncbi:cysteine hydrolase family protein [Microlunatus soli]|uniref:Nicotinamidase-related amidase n=1 Tax=Microlunatus soli TaxID=630515 RepID=A0A1H1TF88_9ACTN|nr:isochorismatase family cysteine hydrolase [Microlunatus soli]SDS58636.1 Nicotinamidase-related amidase [Microlunatus soli]